MGRDKVRNDEHEQSNQGELSEIEIWGSQARLSGCPAKRNSGREDLELKFRMLRLQVARVRGFFYGSSSLDFRRGGQHTATRRQGHIRF